MSNTKHTPGPWEAKNFCSPPETSYVVDSHGELLVGATKKINPADARLIAAAPDLLWALNQAIAYLANPPAFDTDELGKDWWALKAKAEGR